MENERNLSITKGSLLKSIVGDISMNKCNASIHNLSDNHIIDILLRLPVKTIVCCKCVCRDWLNIITDSYFINLHLSNSPECFMVLDKDYEEPITKPTSLKLVEIHEEHGHNHLHHDPIMSLDLNLAPVFQNVRLSAEGSVNGLICFSSSDRTIKKTYICNPITREYMILPKSINDTRDGIYGFGVSLLTSEYKVIRLYYKLIIMNGPCQLYAEIYTLGTGQWRCLGPVTYSVHHFSGTFLNYHVHWNFFDREERLEKICTFDFDDETFQLFPSPPVSLERDTDSFGMLGVLRGCLCYSYYTPTLNVLIWVMKEYGIKNSWQKEVLIEGSICSFIGYGYDLQCFPIGSLKDGSILLVNGLLEYFPGKLLVYHPDTITKEEKEFSVLNAFNYLPSFFKLQNFESECVHKFLR
ncbi:F-box protein At3g07870-like [Rutidosis leptorrhynchoides]|uniref:F-box protein At3g07870-like n=1 Tax=Rutidosis leptorrhynchoides TaxID=125765 RepID=UPI003A996F30